VLILVGMKQQVNPSSSVKRNLIFQLPLSEIDFSFGRTLFVQILMIIV